MATFNAFVDDSLSATFQEKYGHRPSKGSRNSQIGMQTGGRRSSILFSPNRGSSLSSPNGPRSSLSSPGEGRDSKPAVTGRNKRKFVFDGPEVENAMRNRSSALSNSAAVFPSGGPRGNDHKVRGGSFWSRAYRWIRRGRMVGYMEQHSSEASEQQVRFRRWLQKYMATSRVGYFVDLANIFLSACSCIMYVWETYVPERSQQFEYLDVYFTVFFLFDYLLRLYLADNRIRYATTAMALIDLLTILPVILTTFLAHRGWGLTLNLVRVLRVLRIVRINRFILSMVDSEVKKQITMLATNIFTSALFCAGVVHIFENQFREENLMRLLGFHEAIYFVIVTISTVGYGDISPASDLARFCVAGLICAALVYIPKATNHLIVLMSAKSKYARNTYRPPSQTEFVLVCGSFDVVGAQAFLTELFHEDHGSFDLQAVFLCEGLPSTQMENLLRSPRYEVNVTYLQGSPLDVNDLLRASATRASTCFLLCNKFTRDPDAEDAATILRALSIKRFVLQMSKRDIPTCIQLLRNENKQHFTLSHGIMMKDLNMSESDHRQHEELGTPLGYDGTGGHSPESGGMEFFKHIKGVLQSPANHMMFMDQNQQQNNLPTILDSPHNDQSSNIHATGQTRSLRGSEFDSVASVTHHSKVSKSNHDSIICVNEIKMNLLAQACLCPGIITMVGNLVMSVDAPVTNTTGPGNEWLWEYHQGTEFEIYRTKLSSVFELVPFCHASQLVHEKLGALMFGLELTAKGKSRVIMNPGKFLIPPIEEYDVYCFVMAQDLQSADLSSMDDFIIDEDARLHSLGKLNKAKTGGSSFTFNRQMFQRNEMDVTLSDLARQIKDAKLDPKTDFTPDKRASEIRVAPELTILSPNGKPQRDQKSGNMTPANRAWGILKTNVGQGQTPKKARQSQTSDFHDKETGTAAEFYLLDEPKMIEEVTIRHSLRRDFPDVKDHVVICGGFAGLKPLIRTLRAKHLALIMPIVVIHPEAPTASSWNKVSSYPFIFFVQGSSTEREDLARAGVSYASRVIVLARASGSLSNATDETMSDAHAIFAHQGAIGMNRNIQLVTELVNVSNVGFLDIGGVKTRRKNDDQDKARLNTSALSSQFSDAHYHNVLQYIAGIVYSSSMLDTLVSQSYYNPHITTVFHQLIAGTSLNHLEGEDFNDFAMPPSGAIDDEESENERATYVNSIRASHLFQIPIPKNLYGNTYGELFKDLSHEHGIVPLGLVRSTQSPLSPYYKGNAIPYVFTNPPADTILCSKDKVFVLSKEAPSTKLSGKSVAEVLKEMSLLSKQTHSLTMTNNNEAKQEAPPLVEDLVHEIAQLKESITELRNIICGGTGTFQNRSGPAVGKLSRMEEEKDKNDDEDLINELLEEAEFEKKQYRPGDDSDQIHAEDEHKKDFSKSFKRRLKKDLQLNL